MKINLIHKNIAILWYGKEWQSTLRFLQKNGILDGSITILDKNPDLMVENFDGKIISWEHYLNTIEKYDYIFKSPGVSPYINGLLSYKSKILTQTKLFYEFYKWKIISVTQTKGKSTTATLIYKLLKNAGYSVKLVGNIWNPVLDEIDIVKDSYDFVVYELSSYMLEDLENHHSYISIIGNIFEDHLDWHLNFKNYSNAKKNILKNSDYIFVWLDLSKNIAKDLIKTNSITFGREWSYITYISNKYFINGEELDISIEPKIPWEHNLMNFAWVLWISHTIWIDIKIFEKTINNFAGLPHRLENLWSFWGVTFIDDAISTTPESTIQALHTFWKNIGTIFLWGTDRWYSFETLIEILHQYKIKNIVLFPETGVRIKELLQNDTYNILETREMKSAIKFAYKHTKKWKICLLSTASPSYSLWENFEAKWADFKKEIADYNFSNFTFKTRQVKILEERILSSKLIDENLLQDIKKLYNAVPYHNYLHILQVSQYCLSLSIDDFSLIQIRSMMIASLFHDAGHSGKMEILDEFTSLTFLRETMDRYPDYVINDAICRNFIIGTVFQNRAKNINIFAQIGADFDIWCIGEWIWEFMYYSSLFALELWVSSEKFYTEVETGYFKYLMWINKNIIVTENVKKILPNSIKTIKDFYKIPLEKKLEMFEILRTQDITLDEFTEKFWL